MEAFAMRIDNDRTICGDRNLTRKLPQHFRAFFAAPDKPAADELADRSIGPFISTKGSFSIERDAPHQWIFATSLDDSDYRAEVDQVRWAAQRLGSISLDRFALFFSDDTLDGFWIETREADRTRVLASNRSGEEFQAMPAGFVFKAPWIVRALVDLY